MAIQTNPLAPHMQLELSSTNAELVQQYQTGKVINPFRCNNEDVIRREQTNHDFASVMRPSFVRDTEKIMHLQAYNRLAGKTQVFSFRSHDDLTRRGLHVQLVARIARNIGRALGLNIDLIEAIALGHDIGHTPFGHAGERFLNDEYHARTGKYFFHNVMSVRVLDTLYGRNLSLQMLDGAICHNGEFEQQVLELSNLSTFEDFDVVVQSCWNDAPHVIEHLRPMTLEGCVVRISDIIAYIGKDRQDAIRAGIATEKTFDDGMGGAYNAWALSAFAIDIVSHSLGASRISMSEESFEEMRRAKRENYKKIYLASEVAGDLSQNIAQMFAMVYAKCLEWMRCGDTTTPIFEHHILPLERSLSYYKKEYDWQKDLDLTAVDYISAMTDDYFAALCQYIDPSTAKFFPQYSYFA
ncbi:deoxyguanosinetriphosphate triphosphohydrolase family protein [Atopobium fossor]|uniref:deoxyguanosinetriphosphate triphosphohydrolase family protein n=1 Tax=Atopobium fossor TaxID=39487 RepID=UPI00041B2EE1|nr:HD domain-containing protein [Atopobium fossor]